MDASGSSEMEVLQKKTAEVQRKLDAFETEMLSRIEVKSSKEDDAADDDVMPPPSPIASIDFNPLFRQLYLGDSIVEDVGTENDRDASKDAGDHHWSKIQLEKEIEQLKDRLLELEKENNSLKRRCSKMPTTDTGHDGASVGKEDSSSRGGAGGGLEEENADLVNQLVQAKVALADKTEMLSHALRTSSITERTLVAKKLEVAHLKSHSEDLEAKITHLQREKEAQDKILAGTRAQLEAMKQSFEKMSKEKVRLTKLVGVSDNSTAAGGASSGRQSGFMGFLSSPRSSGGGS